MGPAMRVQAPPNLVDLAECRALLDAGVDDFGGISPLTPDHVNPERPWPQLDKLAAVCAEAGFVLRERLTAHPRYLDVPWLDPRLRGACGRAASAPTAGRPAAGHGLPWQEPDGGFAYRRARPTCTPRSTPPGVSEDRRGDFEDVYGDWGVLRDKVARDRGSPSGCRLRVAAALRAPSANPSGLSTATR